MKKNCCNCKWIDWSDGDVGDTSGYFCGKRSGWRESKQERQLDTNLQRKEFREKAKRCCELMAPDYK